MLNCYTIVTFLLLIVVTKSMWLCVHDLYYYQYPVNLSWKFLKIDTYQHISCVSSELKSSTLHQCVTRLEKVNVNKVKSMFKQEIIINIVCFLTTKVECWQRSNFLSRRRRKKKKKEKLRIGFMFQLIVNNRLLSSMSNGEV